MKVNLVVATGVHQGKKIPLTRTQFVIGRDPDCHLRPASPAISKKHCLVSVRDGEVYVADLGSTNGTFVNDEPLTGEVMVNAGDRVRLGPLDFSVEIVRSESKPDNTPLPEALKSVSQGGRLSDGLGMKPVPKPGTPMPMKPASDPAAKPVVKPGTGEHKPVGTEVHKPIQAAAPKPAAPVPAPKPKAPTRSDDPDALAASLLADDDGDAPEVPEGSTVMELPAADVQRLREMSQEAAKPAGSPPAGAKKPTTMSAADSSNAANEILKRYLKKK